MCEQEKVEQAMGKDIVDGSVIVITCRCSPSFLVARISICSAIACIGRPDCQSKCHLTKAYNYRISKMAV